ncbi:MAG: hypothetical protein OQK04_05300 [Kangiellaceae bacterium]|nr:hypothetical protein [Kangiellaceae bacterium]MCW8998111.1 hypothetical protein [Kangiellaceae bacterium]
MPEYPDITVYIEALEQRILSHPVKSITMQSPFLLRTAQIPFDSVIDHNVIALKRIGKRIAIGFDNDIWFVFHLMIAGRFHWKKSGNKKPGRSALIILEFAEGYLYLTEAGHKRASLHILHNGEELEQINPGGVEIFESSLEQFKSQLVANNHTLKRSLTDPHYFSGIGNAYSDEILHHAKISPLKQTQKLSDDEIDSLFNSTKFILDKWTRLLRGKSKNKFPEKVTAFHDEMAVHGKYGQQCPDCGTKVQRIRYASNETNYCPRCQTGGKLLADRAISRLLKKDWPKTIEELENRNLMKK